MSMINFMCLELICIAMQLITFAPFFIVWKKDCRTIGKENLAVSLKDRFKAWIMICPIWFVPIFTLLGR